LPEEGFMSRVRLRLQGARAKVYLLLGMLAWLMCARSASAEPFELAEGEAGPGVVVYPARQPGPHAITVVLHGMCGQPANACRHFAAQVTEQEHLICPRATRRCDGGGASWPHVGFAEPIERSIQRGLAALSALGNEVDETRGRTLIGYSLGAFRALELAEHGAHKYPRVMLIGAKVYPNQRRLLESGVERLLLSAGSADMMHDHMQRETRRLTRAAFPARFLGLGPVGHFFTPSFQEYLPEALLWLRDGGAPSS
jgi:predicted esterase